ncbi:hypothetical protein [Haladaptatus sp. DFWS20]|uniref:hypothetical protein n=1 Tax=Haladaptatus sp. DFWS20 TaxID=3403467 RepID=UPI003EB880A2
MGEEEIQQIAKDTKESANSDFVSNLGEEKIELVLREAVPHINEYYEEKEPDDTETTEWLD